MQQVLCKGCHLMTDPDKMSPTGNGYCEACIAEMAKAVGRKSDDNLSLIGDVVQTAREKLTQALLPERAPDFLFKTEVNFDVSSFPLILPVWHHEKRMGWAGNFTQEDKHVLCDVWFDDCREGDEVDYFRVAQLSDTGKVRIDGKLKRKGEPGLAPAPVIADHIRWALRSLGVSEIRYDYPQYSHFEKFSTSLAYELNQAAPPPLYAVTRIIIEECLREMRVIGATKPDDPVRWSVSDLATDLAPMLESAESRAALLKLAQDWKPQWLKDGPAGPPYQPTSLDAEREAIRAAATKTGWRYQIMQERLSRLGVGPASVTDYAPPQPFEIPPGSTVIQTPDGDVMVLPPGVTYHKSPTCKFWYAYTVDGCRLEFGADTLAELMAMCPAIKQVIERNR